MKIAILGYSGSGKSTLARRLSIQHHLPLLHLDQVQFNANWELKDRTEAKQLVKDVMTTESDWVIDGNYSEFYQEERLKEADVILYFKFSAWRCLVRVLKRYWLNRGQTRQDAAPGCIESLNLPFIWWVLFEGRKPSRQRYYKKTLLPYEDKLIVLKRPGDVTRYLASQKNNFVLKCRENA